jgi:DNA polymerase-4
LREATGSTAAFLDASHILLLARRDEIARRRLTLLGVTIANLSTADAVQQALPFDDRSSLALDHAVDAVRNRFGSASIGRATLLGSRRGLTMPLLPDPVERRP